MRFAVYCFVAPLFVAFLVLLSVGLIVRGAYSSLKIGFKMPDNYPQIKRTWAARQTPAQDPTRGPGGYHGNL
jgi:hypothetical protein